MEHLASSFRKYRSLRGCHFYNDTDCSFRTWEEVCAFANLPSRSAPEVDFSEKLLEIVANYDPSKEILAVKQEGSTATIELYALRDSI